MAMKQLYYSIVGFPVHTYHAGVPSTYWSVSQHDVI